MLKTFIKSYKNLDTKTSHILKKGLIFSFIVCIVSIIILLTYLFVFSSPTIFYIGLLVFQLGLSFSIEFIICAIIVDNLKKNLI